jgi:hypothetical protein
VERKFEIIGEALKRASEADPNLVNAIPDLRRIVPSLRSCLLEMLNNDPSTT